MSRQAEIISAILLVPACRDQVFDKLHDYDFSGPCAVWFERMRKLYKQGPDRLDNQELHMQCISELRSELADRGSEGWEIAMSGMVGDTIRRKADSAAARVSLMCSDQSISPEELVDMINDIVHNAIDTRVAGKSGKTTSELLKDAWESSLLRAKGEDSSTIPWCTGALDQYVRIRAGQEGSYGVIAARPGVGKTSLMCTAAAGQIMRGIRVGIIGIETGYQPYIYRVQAIHSGLTFAQLERGHHVGGPSEQFGKVYTCMQKYLHLSCGPQDIGAIRSKVKHWVRELGVQIIYIDYIGVIGGKTRSDMRNHTEMCSGSLHEICRGLNVPTIVLSQMNRESAGAMPKPEHIRFGDALLQDADFMLLLDRPDTEAPDIGKRPYAEDTTGKMVVIVAKSRYGEKGYCICDYDGSRMKITSRDITKGVTNA